MLDTSILLVEDDWSDEELIKRQFRLNHVLNELIVVRDGEEALDYLLGRRRYRGRDTSVVPGLILLGLQLPKLSGLDVLRQLLVTPLAEPLTIVTLSGGPADQADEVMALGGKGALRKPSSFAALRALAEQLGFQWLGLEYKNPYVYGPTPFKVVSKY